MADIFEGDSGQLYVKLPGNRYQPVSRDDAAIIQESGLGALARSVLNSVEQLPTGAGTLIGHQPSRAAFQRLQQEQAARSIGNPLASFAGSVAPDVAIGMATAGTGSLGTQMLRTGLVEGGLGAARNPENPLAGAAIQGGLGAVGVGAIRGMQLANGVIRGSRNRAAAAANPTRVSGDINAARNPNPTFERTRRELHGYATPEVLEDAGFKLTGPERAALEATDPDTLAKANRRIDLDEILASTNVFGDVKVGDVPIGDRLTRADHKQAFTKFIANTLEQPNIETLTRATRGEILEETQDVFKHYIDNNPHPIDLNRFIDGRYDPELNPNLELPDRVGQPTILDDIKGAAETAGVNAEKQVTKIVEKIEASLDKDGLMKPKDFASIHKEVSEASRRAFDNGNYDLGTAMGQVRSALDEAAERVALKYNPNAAKEIAEARRKYGIIKALERGSATDPDGKVNPKTFANNYARFHRGYKTGKRNDEFSSILDAAQWLTQRRTPDSGTAARVAGLARLVGSVGQQAPLGAGVATTGAGLGWLFGD